MDALGLRPRISPSGALALATIGCLALPALPACTRSRTEGSAPRTATIDDRNAAPDSDAGPVARPPSRSPHEFARVETAIRRFADDRAGRLPVSLEDLVTERSPEGNRYLASLPVDAWGRPYSYAVVSARFGTYDLRSYGPDTLPGTADDIVSAARPVPTH